MSKPYTCRTLAGTPEWIHFCETASDPIRWETTAFLVARNCIRDRLMFDGRKLPLGGEPVRSAILKWLDEKLEAAMAHNALRLS